MKYLLICSTLLFSLSTQAESLNRWIAFDIFIPDNIEHVDQILTSLQNHEEIDKSISMKIIRNAFVPINTGGIHEDSHYLNRDYVKHADTRTGKLEISTTKQGDSIYLKHIKNNRFLATIKIARITNIDEKKSEFGVDTKIDIENRVLHSKVTLNNTQQQILSMNGIVLSIKRLPDNYGVIGSI